MKKSNFRHGTLHGELAPTNDVQAVHSRVALDMFLGDRGNILKMQRIRKGRHKGKVTIVLEDVDGRSYVNTVPATHEAIRNAIEEALTT